jgi:hypothetical protein
MDTFKININRSDITGKYTVTTSRGREHLFCFYKSPVDEKVWYFDIPENGQRQVFTVSDELPVRHILEITVSLITIRYGIVGFDIQFTSQAKRLLGAK